MTSMNSSDGSRSSAGSNSYRPADTDALANQRARRFKMSVEEATQESKERQYIHLLVDACCALAPVFDVNPRVVSQWWRACCDEYANNEAPAEFEAMLAQSDMSVVTAAHPCIKKRGKCRNTLMDLLTNPQSSDLWRQFAERAMVTYTVVLVFRPGTSRTLWVMTNRPSGTDRLLSVSRLVIPVEGAPAVIVMPLKTYVEECVDV